MRCHNAEGLASTRKAIDATLSAYLMILDPSTINKYKARAKLFQYIKAHMEKVREKDNTKFPLAVELIEFHNLCSQYGSHADIDGFIGRMERKVKELSVMYFEIQGSKKEFQLEFAKTSRLRISWDFIPVRQF